jgi:hypothetical protein
MASLPATAAIAAPDPIFAAIEAFHTADAACVAGVDGDIPDEVADRFSEAYAVVLRTCPTTPAGLAALTSWARERVDWLRKNYSTPRPDDVCNLAATIDDAVRGMTGLHPWSPPQLADTANVDPIFAAIEKREEALEAIRAASLEARRLRKIADEKIGDWRKLPEERRTEYARFLDSISPNGDHDSIIEGPADIAGEAMNGLTQTVPTSREGFIALSIYAGAVIRDRESTFDESDLRNLLLSLADAADEA